MIVCGKCGTENPLGRVFCGKCGTKLDLQHVTSEAVSDMVEKTFLQKHLKKFILVIVLLVLAVVAMAFIPQGATLGKPGTAVDTRRTESMLKTGNAMSSQAARVVFTEEMLNSYVDPNRAKTFGVDSITVSTKQAVVSVRIKKRLGPILVQGREIGLPMSFDVAYRAFPDGRVGVFSAAMGRLPLFGPLKGIATGALKSALSKDPDIQKALERANHYTFEEGKVSVVLAPKK